MRVLHVVTLISEDGAYGGPARVAVNQAEALVERGHDVTVIAAGRGPLPVSAGVHFRLFTPVGLVPRSGYAGLAAPGMLRWILKHGREFDVVHVHLARDLVTLPAARLCRALGVRVVAQTHGMIDPSGKLLAGPLDVLLTKPVLRAAAAVFHLTSREREDLIGVAGQAMPLVLLTNGVPVLPERRRRDHLEVLFLARLHPRKRADLFVDMAEIIVRDNDSAVFALVGPDEGSGAEIERRTVSYPHIRWEGAIAPSSTADRMRDAAVYVLPSMDEPYPMSVLEAMAVGLPVVVSDTCGLAPDVGRIGCGIVVPTGDLVALVSAVRHLLQDSMVREDMGARGRLAARTQFGTAAVAETLELHYEGETRDVG